VEVEKLPGTGKYQLASPSRGGAGEALRIAYDQVKKNLSEYGIKEALSLYDLRVQIANPMEADDPSLLGIPIFVAILSALRGQALETGSSWPATCRSRATSKEWTWSARSYSSLRRTAPFDLPCPGSAKERSAWS
jgi:hypothetical protein